VLIALRDQSGTAFSLLGLRDQLGTLAEHLDATTDLGTRPAMLLPTAVGVDAIIARYLSPLAIHFLGRLRSVRTPEPSLVDSLAAELDLLCDPSTVVHESQLALGGIRVRRA